MKLARLIFVALVAGCSGRPATIVRVELTYEESWGLTGVEVAAGDRHARSDIARVIRLMIPDEWADHTTDIDVWGLRGEERLAFAHLQTSPVLHGEVTVQATLGPVPCGASCSPGAHACQGDATVVCEQRDEDACWEWSQPTPCPTEAPFCSGGVCAADCVDECAEGGVSCDGPGGTRTCGRADSDPCLDWGPFVACGAGQTCSNGADGMGACQAAGDPCDGVTCDAVPAPMCLDETTLRTYGPGSCDGGACGYPPADTPCAAGCQDGACCSGTCPPDACGTLSDACGTRQCSECSGNNYCGADGTPNTCTTAAFLGPYDAENICPPGFDFVEICPSGGGMVCLAAGVPDGDFTIEYDYQPLDCASGLHRALTWHCAQLMGTLCVAD